MGRLTKINEDACQFCKTWDYCIEEEACFLYEVYEKLQDYEDLEEQGRLIELPCAVGDTMHYILGDKIVEGKVSMLQQKVDKSWKIRITRNGNAHDITLDEIGRHYFLTKEEAEAKLNELEGE